MSFTVRIFLSVSQAISLFTSALPVIGPLKADEEKREGVLDLIYPAFVSARVVTDSQLKLKSRYDEH